MSGFTNYTSAAALAWVSGLTAMPALPAVWLGLFTAVGTDAGTGFTEASGNNYARTQVAGNAATNNTTASGNATLHFGTTPAWVVAGMTVTDASAAVIPAGTTVLSTTGTTVTMSANATGGGVGNGDTINFSAFGAASGTSPSVATSTAAVTFAQSGAGGGFGTIEAFGLFDALSTGNLLEWDYLGNFSWLPCSVSSASPGVITTKAHGYSAADSVIFSTEYGGTAPSFSQGNFTGVLSVNSSPATDTFTVNQSATSVNTSSTGDGMVRKITQQATVANMVLSFAAGQLLLVCA
jgi:hypothetical protein